jgi:hypothetical protein
MIFKFKVTMIFLCLSVVFACGDSSSSKEDEIDGESILELSPPTVDSSEDSTADDVLDDITAEPKSDTTFGYTSRVLKKKDENVYFFSALQTNDYSNQNYQAEADLEVSKTFDIDSDFGDLIVFRIETPESLEGQKISTPSEVKLKDSWVSLSYESAKTSSRIQLCAQPVFRPNTFFEETVVYDEDYYFGETYGIFPNQDSLLKKWRNSFLAEYYDSFGLRIPCANLAKSKYEKYRFEIETESQLVGYLTASPGVIRWKIDKGLKIREFHDVANIERVGLEAIFRIEFK